VEDAAVKGSKTRKVGKGREGKGDSFSPGNHTNGEDQGGLCTEDCREGKTSKSLEGTERPNKPSNFGDHSKTPNLSSKSRADRKYCLQN